MKGASLSCERRERQETFPEKWRARVCLPPDQRPNLTHAHGGTDSARPCKRLVSLATSQREGRERGTMGEGGRKENQEKICL